MAKLENALIIGNNLKRIRVSKYGWTQKEFAEFIGMSVQNLSQTERGIYKPGLDKLLKIAEVLRVTPNDLLLDHSNDETIATSSAPTDQLQQQLKKDIENHLVLDGQKSSFLVDSTMDLLNFMNNWEPYRSAAKKAKSEGDVKKERSILKYLADQLATQNSDWQTFIDRLYFGQLDQLLKKSSTDFQDSLLNSSES